MARRRAGHGRNRPPRAGLNFLKPIKNPGRSPRRAPDHKSLKSYFFVYLISIALNFSGAEVSYIA